MDWFSATKNAEKQITVRKHYRDEDALHLCPIHHITLTIFLFLVCYLEKSCTDILL